jgi:hypothetical protein
MRACHARHLYALQAGHAPNGLTAVWRAGGLRPSSSPLDSPSRTGLVSAIYIESQICGHHSLLEPHFVYTSVYFGNKALTKYFVYFVRSKRIGMLDKGNHRYSVVLKMNGNMVGGRGNLGQFRGPEEGETSFRSEVMDIGNPMLHLLGVPVWMVEHRPIEPMPYVLTTWTSFRP